jgi:hypothetical protein
MWLTPVASTMSSVPTPVSDAGGVLQVDEHDPSSSVDRPPAPGPPGEPVGTRDAGPGVFGPERRWGRRRRPFIVGAGAVVLLAAALGLAGGVRAASTGGGPVQPADPPMSPVADRSPGAAAHVALAPATSQPAPAPPSVADTSTQPHEVFAYAPYWTLPQAEGFPVQDFTTIAYFSVDVNADGTIDRSGAGWDGYQSQDLVDLVTRAHQAGVRVVLTATCFDQSTLDALTHDPSAWPVLGATLSALVAAKDLDGVNVDFEGAGSGDQAGLDRLVAEVSAVLHQANPNDQLTMATYASSASDSGGFYDIAGLAPSVSAFFVMAYELDQPASPGPAAPLAGGSYTDQSVLAQYSAAAGPGKVILGVPLYGYDWPTAGPALGDPSTGPGTPVTYAQAMGSGTTYWDPATLTAWTSYRAGSQWHQVFFDNADSLALKTQQASASGVLGIGVWALGMEGGDAAVLGVLDGGQAPAHLPPPGPSARLAWPAAPTTTTTTAPDHPKRGGHHHGGAASTTTTGPGAPPTTVAPTTTTTVEPGPTTTTTTAPDPPGTTTTVPPETTTTVGPATTATTTP